MSSATAIDIRQDVTRSRPAELISLEGIRANELGERLLHRLRQMGAVDAKEFFSSHSTPRSPETRLAIQGFVSSAVREGTISGLAGVRTMAGMTQLELARALGVAQPQIARWERPEHFEGIAVANLRRLAQALNADVRDFFRSE